jgi:general secretion pathway protein E
VAQHAVAKVAAGLVDPRMAERVVGLLPAAGAERTSIALPGGIDGA